MARTVSVQSAADAEPVVAKPPEKLSKQRFDSKKFANPFAKKAKHKTPFGEAAQVLVFHCSPSPPLSVLCFRTAKASFFVFFKKKSIVAQFAPEGCECRVYLEPKRPCPGVTGC